MKFFTPLHETQPSARGVNYFFEGCTGFVIFCLYIGILLDFMGNYWIVWDFLGFFGIFHGKISVAQAAKILDSVSDFYSMFCPDLS